MYDGGENDEVVAAGNFVIKIERVSFVTPSETAVACCVKPLAERTPKVPVERPMPTLIKNAPLSAGVKEGQTSGVVAEAGSSAEHRVVPESSVVACRLRRHSM